MPENQKPRWTMTVTVFHGPSFSHSVELATETRGAVRYSQNDTIGSWTGRGVPEEVMDQMETMIVTAFQSYVYTSYGVSQSLLQWKDEPDPF